MDLDGRMGLSSSVTAAVLVIILVLAGSAAYLSFSQAGPGPNSVTTLTSVSTYQPTGSTTSTSLSSSFTSSSAASILSTTSSSVKSSSTTTSTSVTTSTSSTNKSEVIVIIPPGIQDLANKVSFEPINVTVVIGVNNTIVFVNKDNEEHILESTSWPANGQPFQFYSLPGSSVSITLTTPGDYTYFCEWHPIWMDGLIVVLP